MFGRPVVLTLIGDLWFPVDFSGNSKLGVEGLLQHIVEGKYLILTSTISIAVDPQLRPTW